MNQEDLSKSDKKTDDLKVSLNSNPGEKPINVLIPAP